MTPETRKKLKQIERVNFWKKCAYYVKWIVVPVVIGVLAALVIMDLTSPDVISEKEEFHALTYSLIILLLCGLIFVVKIEAERNWRDILWNLEERRHKREMDIINLEGKISRDERELFREQNKLALSNRNPKIIYQAADILQRDYLRLGAVYSDKADIFEELMEIWQFAKRKGVELPGFEGRWKSIDDIKCEHFAAEVIIKMLKEDVKRMGDIMQKSLA